jgi:hypothetical protein
MTARTQIRPRPVFCVVAHAYRDLAVAGAVCAGRFTHAGVTLDLGVEPDWLTAALPPDAEWRIEWSKFYYGLDLAHAYQETGDVRFARAWERLVRSWIRQVPAGFDTSDVAARRVQNWIYAWNAFVSSTHFPGFADGFEEALLDSLSSQAAHLREHLSAERNHRTLELYALFVAALALPELDADGSLLEFAVGQLHRNLLADIRPDGVHREHSTHYHMLVLRSLLGARENARRFSVTFPEGFDAHLQRACEFAMHCHRPDGQIPALSDSDTGAYADVLELAARLFSRDDFLYVATAGARGTAPERRNVSFPDGGYFIQRSDWGDGATFKDARYLIFDCGPLGDGGHGHYDVLNVELAANGRALVVDPGRFTYSEHACNWRRWFKGTAAHNTVCVDGLDQTPYRCGKPKGETASGRLIERLSAPSLDVICGEASSPAYEARHTRRIFFVAGEYWLVVDELRGGRPHRYDLRFHLTSEALGHTHIGSNGLNHFVSAPGLALVFDTTRQPHIETGWVAPLYGVKLPAPVVSVITEGMDDACFFTVVMPQASNASAPRLVVQAEQSGSSEMMFAEIAGVGWDGSSTDRIVWSATARPFELGQFSGRASAAWLRACAAGKPSDFAACNVSELKHEGEPRAEFAGAEHARWVAWDARRGVTRDEGEIL